MIRRCDFRPAWWLPGRHLQTLYPSLCRRRTRLALERERIELPDGDFLDIDWTAPRDRPAVLLLHGLEGSIESHYATGLLAALQRAGWCAGLMYFRGCSGEVNRLPRSYHSGETGDLDYVVRLLQSRAESLHAVVGISLGGNVLLKWLGEHGNATGIVTAIAVSVPFDLDAAARRLDRGLSRIYRRHLLHRLRQSVRRKAAAGLSDYPLEQLDKLSDFRAFDNAITAPLHGFRDVDDYYARCSSRPFLRHIQTNTLILQAIDDPFLPADAIPAVDEMAASVNLELAAHGGHVGFVSGLLPLRPRYWLEQRIVTWLTESLGKPAPRTRPPA